MATIPIALQLYSIRHDCEKDLPGTLEAVAKMGYDGVEFAGYYGRSAGELRKLLDDLGLRVAGTHTRLDTRSGVALAKPGWRPRASLTESRKGWPLKGCSPATTTIRSSSPRWVEKCPGTHLWATLGRTW